MFELAEKQKTMVTLQHICEICNLQASKYQCPKCTLKYCSLSCYKLQLKGSSLNSTKSNQFYTIHEKCLRFVQETKEKEFKELLKSVNNRSNKNDVEKIEHILLKDSMERQKEISGEKGSFDEDSVEECSDADSIASDELQEILKIMSLEEKQNFYRFCDKLAESSQDGHGPLITKKDDLFELLKQKTFDHKQEGIKFKIWKPWWLRENNSFALIQDMNESNNSDLPIIHVNPMKSRMSINPKLKYHIVDFLLAYICSCKILNGELLEELPDMMHTFSYSISTSMNLSSKTGGERGKTDQSSFLYENISEVIQIFKCRLISSGYCQSKDAILVFMNDLIVILENHQYVQAALSDLIRAFRSSKLFLARKCTFFLSLFNSFSSNMIADLILEIKMEAQKERDEFLVESTLNTPSKTAPIDPFFSKESLIHIVE